MKEPKIRDFIEKLRTKTCSLEEYNKFDAESENLPCFVCDHFNRKKGYCFNLEKIVEYKKEHNIDEYDFSYDGEQIESPFSHRCENFFLIPLYRI